MIGQGLVLDSRLSARKKLVNDIQESNVVRNIIEASSLSDGLYRLKVMHIDACLIGHSVSNQATTKFIQQGSKVARQRDCAFIVVVREDEEGRKALSDMGAHGVIKKPYQTKTITEVVKKAVARAKGISLEALDAEDTKPRDGLLELLDENLDVREVAKSTLASSITEIAAGLRTISQNLTTGMLSLQPDGKPSLASRDAMRLVFEKVLVPSGERDIGSVDDLFIGAVVQWFVEKVDDSHNMALENLRRRLLAYEVE